MTTIDSKGGLAIAIIVFFSPALLVSLFIVFRHGFSRQMGWLYLVVLSLLRLIGNSALLYSETQHNYSSGLLETIYITSAVGTAPLLLALLGFLSRVHEGMKAAGTNLPDLVFRGLSLLSLAALIIAIIGGTSNSGDSASGPSLSSTGHDLMKAASILFLVMYLALAAITLLTFTRKSSVLSGERKLVDAGLAALPFLLVRIIYTVCASFSTSPSSIFYFGAPNVYVEAFMQFLMEAIVVVIFMVAGLLTPKVEKTGVRDVEGLSQPKHEHVPMTDGAYSSQAPRMRQDRPARNLGDYRPSRLIRDAISGR